METEKRFLCTYSRQENKDITKEYEKNKEMFKAFQLHSPSLSSL